MPRYLVASYLPDNFDPSTVTPEIGAAIHALNDEMEAAGALKFACGVSPVSMAKTLRKQPDGKLLVTDGPYTETKDHIGGFLMLDAADMDEVVAWMRKGAAGVVGPVEIRQLFFQP
ncbi:MAG: YciI family protein, partial [bacterium]